MTGRDRFPIPEAVQNILEDFRTNLGTRARLWLEESGQTTLVYADGAAEVAAPCGPVEAAVETGGSRLLVEVEEAEGQEGVAPLLACQVGRALEYDHEVRFFTYELSERYEEINLLYSISETLGSVLQLEDAARAILQEVCDVLSSYRGSLWVYDHTKGHLHLVASVGREGREDPVPIDDPAAVTARVFREGRSLIFGPSPTRVPAGPPPQGERRSKPREPDSMISVPIHYTPPAGRPRTVGVINLMGRRTGEAFSASDQKLLAAIASQVGAALENNRLIHESLAQERVAREMELAHDLQMKLLPSVALFEAAEVGARVMPAESVGGDFYQLFELSEGRIGVMIGDVSSHGFPAALMMALSMSAAAIQATVGDGPASVIRRLDDAVFDELENTEMYLTLFYAVIDRERRTLEYTNAGHPYAFVVGADGEAVRLPATDPPVGMCGPEAYHSAVHPWESGEDLLLLFTDGLSDLLSGPTRGTGEARVLDTVVANRRDPPRLIVDRLFQLAENADSSTPSDDRTALILRA